MSRGVQPARGAAGGPKERARARNPGAWREARRLLCVRLDALGDVVMTGPAIRALAEQSEGRRITLLTSPAGAEAASLMAEVDEVIVYQSPWMKATPPARRSHRDVEMIELLQGRRFDAAVIFTVYSQSPLPAALLLHLAEVPLTLAHCHENPYHLLSDWIPDPEPADGIRHEVRRQLDLVATVGARPADERLRVSPRGSARSRVDRLLAELGLAMRRDWIVLHPGASAPSRRYPARQFGRAAAALAEEQGLMTVVVGSAGETPLARAIGQEAGGSVIDLTGRLDLHELAALLERSPLLLCNNSGPAHLAAACGTPIVQLYALTNPQHTPWTAPSRVLFHDVPCRFCYRSVCPQGHHACLREVEPSALVANVAELLEAVRSDGRGTAAAAAGRPGYAHPASGTP